MTQQSFDASQLSALWQSLPTEPVSVTAYDMRMRAALFEGRIRRRNRIEFIACGIVAMAFSFYATFKSTTILWPIANIMLVLATLYVAFNLHRKGKADATPDGGDVPSLIDFHRRAMIRQRDVLKTAWRWYLGPFIPGMILWFIAMWLGPGMHSPKPAAAAMGLALVVSVCIAVFVIVTLYQFLGAARLQRMIDDLDRYKEKD